MTLSPTKAAALLKKFSRQRILVVGDLMLDRFLYGTVSRISPEAPVPIVHVTKEISMPGGASNVASNIRALGGRVSVAGRLGKDTAGEELAWLLKQAGVDTSASPKLAGCSTIVKERVIAERQQVVRVDFETLSRQSKKDETRFLSLLALEMERADGIILEDYGKGTLTQKAADVVMEYARFRRIPVGLDPKDGHDLSLKGITVATPNRKEAFAIAGIHDPGAEKEPLKDKALIKVGEALVEKWQARHIVITLGAHGMFLLSHGKSPIHLPTHAREVFDVSGAGDTVIAACMTALAAGADFVSAAGLANVAAGVVVGKLGTASCTPAELLAYMRGNCE